MYDLSCPFAQPVQGASIPTDPDFFALCFRACFVGLVYGYATILSSSIIVPMASHAANNLVGGILWRYTSNSSQKS